MTRIELVVFDWDGTLMDSAARIVAAVRSATAATGLPPLPDEAIRAIIGLGVDEALATLYPQLTVAERRRVAATYYTAFARAAADDDANLFPDAEAALATLAADGRQLAIATGKSRAGLRRDLAATGLAARFAASRTVDEAPSKPDPAMLEAVMEMCGVGPAATLMVGDTEFDLTMAARAGVRAFGVDWGVHSRARLQAAQPLAILDRIDDLAGHIRRLEAAPTVEPAPESVISRNANTQG